MKIFFKTNNKVIHKKILDNFTVVTFLCNRCNVTFKDSSLVYKILFKNDGQESIKNMSGHESLKKKRIDQERFKEC